MLLQGAWDHNIEALIQALALLPVTGFLASNRQIAINFSKVTIITTTTINDILSIHYYLLLSNAVRECLSSGSGRPSKTSQHYPDSPKDPKNGTSQ